jgi:lipoprotein-anchoring transpeptidase ErfK/SrfK
MVWLKIAGGGLASKATTEHSMRLQALTAAVSLVLATALAGCTSVDSYQIFTTDYYGRADAGYRVPAIPIDQVPRRYHRQIVSYSTNEAPGTILVDTKAKYLYFVEPEDRAVRYGIGVGREGFAWSGTARVGAKREWPVWTPPPEMIARQPKLAKWRYGQPPGPSNALGARALYLFDKGDTGYRLHGTPEWWSIGKAMSSGCVRMLNQDIIDLYARADIGAKVIVE